MGRWSLRQSAGDTPLARWLVELAEARGWRSGRQAALYLTVNHSAFAAWLRGDAEPDQYSQEKLSRAAGVPVAEVADLVWRTKSEKQRLTVGDLQRRRAQEAQELPPPPSATTDLDAIVERLERIERKLDERKPEEGLSELEIRVVVDEILRRREQGTLPETYIDDPAVPESADDGGDLREAVG